MTAALARGHEAEATLILSRGDVASLMRPADWLQAVEAGFHAAAEGEAQAPPPMTIAGLGGTFHAKGASLRLGRLYVALKLNGNFPDNPAARGLPTIQGAVLLCDGETGALLAIIDSIEITLRRTAAATALAARYLARPDAETILVCGCGAQGRAQLAALRELLPLKRAFAWDRDVRLAQAFAAELDGPGLSVEAVCELSAARDADVIVTCTTSRVPFLAPSHVKRGAFVAAVGADSPDKSEIEPALMADALIVADLRDQCAAMGDLHHALAAGMAQDRVHAELGELVTGRKRGRTCGNQITLFDSTGTALQDVAAAALVYERARLTPATLSVALGAAA
jgi:alanine dehydrogenase